MTRPWLQVGPAFLCWMILNFIILPAWVHNPVAPDGYFLQGIHGDPEALEDARYIVGACFWCLYYLLDPPPERVVQGLAFVAAGWLLWVDSNSFGVRMFPHWELLGALVLAPGVWWGMRRA